MIVRRSRDMMFDQDGRPAGRARRRTVAALLPLAAVSGLLSGCEEDLSCTGGLQAYKGKCLSTTAIVYLECTDGKGYDVTTEIGAGVAGTFKAIAGASVKAAYKKSSKEDTTVALQIVHDCLKIAEAASDSAAEQGAARSSVTQVDQYLKRWQEQQVKATPHIRLSDSSAASGEPVTVSGTGFWPNETVDVYVHATLVTQLPVDAEGSFRTTITIPDNVPPPSFNTTIHVSGESSSASARAPFHSA